LATGAALPYRHRKRWFVPAIDTVPGSVGDMHVLNEDEAKIMVAGAIIRS
jgi:hypothetical protein